MPWYWLDFSRGVDWPASRAGRHGLALASPAHGGCCRCSCPWACGLRRVPRNDVQTRATLLVASGLLGLALTLVQGFGVGLRGWNAEWLTALFGAPGRSRPAWAGRASPARRVPVHPLPRARRARAVPRRRFVRRRRSALVVGADRCVFIFYPVLQDPGQRGRRTMPAASRPASSWPSSPTARSGASAALSGDCAAAWRGTRCSSRVLDGAGTHAARPRLRADRDAHGLPRQAARCGC